MKPGQPTLNELELALLQCLAPEFSALAAILPKLHVLSREYTGVGSFTNFKSDDVISTPDQRHAGIPATVSIPNLEHSLGALVFFEEGKLKMLEIHSLWDMWDGTYEGFSIHLTPQPTAPGAAAPNSPWPAETIPPKSKPPSPPQETSPIPS